MMSSRSFAQSITSAPAVFAPDAAQRFRDEFGAEFAQFAQPVQDLLNGAAGCSPYLRRLMARRKADLAAMLEAPPELALEAAMEKAFASRDADNIAEQMHQLREAKATAALVIALADLGGVWDVMTATAALSRFADAAVTGALDGAVRRSTLPSSDGVVVLAMGKHGAFELNYSSDVDLVVLFDRDLMKINDVSEAQKHAVSLAKELINLMQTQTADGYVFRTDLRLRPDPGVTALAVSVRSAEAYYESFGQNWERMAFIKARPCAGDLALGESFLKTLRPFIWRKYLDYAAIEDVHAVKRQMHSAKGGGDVAFEGHDVKLGRGGIREVEFYAQTQQLILGGKNQALRLRPTLDALAALTAAGTVSQTACDALSKAYLHLRFVEHRLQMINDEQTHRIPTAPEEIERLAMFSGARSAASFREELLSIFRTVEKHYDTLFETTEDAESRLGALVFTGVEAHPATLQTLAKLGFERGPEISAAIRRWHTGALRATRSERARVLLTKMAPPLLEALSKAGDPDEAFFAFEDFLSRLPAGVQVFSLLLNNLEIFDALIRIMTISPYLGREFSKRLNLVERLLNNRWSAPPPAPETYASECAALVAAAPDYEAALNAARRWAGEQKFQITAQLAVGLLPYAQAAKHFSEIANAAINALIVEALDEMRAQHGTIDGEFVVVGLGRLGAGEMTATSDIDLMFVYDAPSDAMSDGKRPLGSVDYFTRLVRRAVTALSAATEEGALYEVDMQLRPSGKAGPAAVSLAAFRRYYQQEAWVWETMALVKSRIIGPPGALGETLSAELGAIIARARDKTALAADVVDMRVRLDNAKPGISIWDVKNIVGGLTDIAFICQYLTLLSAHRLGRPPRAVAQALSWFAKNGELAQEDAMILSDAHSVFEAVLQASRAATGGVFTPERAGEALSVRMASVCGADDIDGAEQMLAQRQSETARLFGSIVGDRLGRDGA